jgi:feruloyl esterase
LPLRRETDHLHRRRQPVLPDPGQADAANRIYSGPVDERGRHLAIGGLPYGSELAWIGSMALQPGQTFSFATSGDYTYSYDWPNYLSRWSGPTGITNRNIKFTSDQFEYLMQTAPAIESTNPDLSAFYRNGGKLIMWDGWADTGSSPYAVVNYHDAVSRTLGRRKTDKFVKLYMPPGEYHCGGGPTAASADYLTPLMNWREQGHAATPGKIVTTFWTSSTDSTITRTVRCPPSRTSRSTPGRATPTTRPIGPKATRNTITRVTTTGSATTTTPGTTRSGTPRQPTSPRIRSGSSVQRSAEGQ